MIFYFRFEKFHSSEGRVRYAAAGYATVYRYYAYPTHLRPRISQVLTLPPFRKLGICAHLIQVSFNFKLTDSTTQLVLNCILCQTFHLFYF